MPWECFQSITPSREGENQRREKALQRKQCLNWDLKDLLRIKEEQERAFEAMFQGLKECRKNGTFEDMRSSECLDSRV